MTLYRKRPRKQLRVLPLFIMTGVLIILLVIGLIITFFSKDPIQDINYDEPIDLVTKETQSLYQEPSSYPKKFYYDSGIDIPYPEEGVKGI